MKLSKFIKTFCLSVISTTFLINIQKSILAQEIPDDPRPSNGFNLVYEDDDRGELNSRRYPWTAIRRLDLPNGGHCTGTLVGVDLVLTNAHCVENDSGNLRQGIRFRPNLIDNESVLLQYCTAS